MTATSPTPLLVPAAPPVAPERGAPAAGKKTDSFAQQLARQRDAAANDTRAPAGPVGKPAKPADGKPASDPAAGQQDSAAEAQPATPATDPATAAAAGAAAVQAQAQAQPPVSTTPPALPAQALEIATQAAQLQQQAAPARHAAAQAAAPLPISAPAPQGKATPAPALATAAPIVASAAPAAAPPAQPFTPPSAAVAANSAGNPTTRAAGQDIHAAATPAPPPATTLEGLALADGDAEAALREATHLVALAGATPASQPAGNDAPVVAPGLAAAGLAAARQDANASPLLPPGAGPLTLGIATPVAATPAWGADLGRQMVLLSHDATQGRQTAELRLDPPDLGPLRVTLSVNDGVASASFVSAHAAVRHAVEAALPQLQQALAQAGLSLGQANVGEHGAQSGFDMQQQSQGRGQGGGGAAGDSGAVVAQAPAGTARRGDGLVDTFA